MKLTIVTLTYKNWRDLEIAINSVSSQIIDKKYSVEYFIVDDGTPDFDYQYVLELLVSRCPFDYKIIQNEKNKGTVKSFNYAIKQAMGDIIIPLSADDLFYDKDVVNSIANRFEDPDVRILTTMRMPIIKGRELPCIPNKYEIGLFQNQEKLKHHTLAKGNFISGAATSYRKQTLVELNYFDESFRLLEDYPFYVKALLNNIRIDILEIISIKYGMEGVTAIGTVNPILRADFIKLYRFIIATGEVNAFWRRSLYYSKVLSKQERLSLRAILLYPEQFIISSCKRVARLFK